MKQIQNATQKRELVIERLKDAFAEGQLALESYESRVSSAENAITVADLENLVVDLPQSEHSVSVSDSETVHCSMATKELSGSILKTRNLMIESSMSTLTIDYLRNEPMRGFQEIRVDLNMTTLILRLPDDVVVENQVQETMSTFKEYRNKYYDPSKPRMVIKITGSSKMSTIKVKRKKYWWFSKKK